MDVGQVWISRIKSQSGEEIQAVKELPKKKISSPGENKSTVKGCSKKTTEVASKIAR